MSGSAHILLVDGDPSTRVLTRLVLENAYPNAIIKEIDAAVPFAEAWSDAPWRVALYDPGTSPWAQGGRLITALKRHDPGLKVIVLSSELTGDAIADLFRAGADDVLRKTTDVLVELPKRLEPSLVDASPRPESDLGEPTVEAFVDERELLQTEMPQPPRDTTPPDPAPARDASAMIHDLKEPLRTIHMLLDRCDRKHRDELPAEARGLIQWAQRSAQQLSFNLDELQAELSGDLGPGATVADANEALSDALRHLRALGEETGAQVTTSGLPTVEVPPSAVRRILENLLANAMRHRGENTPEIHVGARVLDTEAVFSVRDNGPGIPEALRHRVFEPGVRGEEGGGTGLGLHGTRRLVERWGGRIWIDTVRGEGTTFFFTLPMAVGRPTIPSGSKN